jgi:hypothetical protein
VDNDNPEAFLAHLPPTKELHVQELRRNMFNYVQDFFYDNEEESDDVRMYTEDGAYVRQVPNSYNGRDIYVAVRDDHPNPERRRSEVVLTDLQHRTITTYRHHISFAEAAMSAIALAAKLENGQAEIVGRNRLIVHESMITESKHKADCTCGFCKNKGSFGKKEKAEAKPEMTAESVVDTLLENDYAQRMKIGADVESEHTSDPKKKRKIAREHMRENPKYYPKTPKPKGAKEALRWTK